MKSAPDGPPFDPRRLSIEDLQDPSTVEEALAHWDELEPALLLAIETHPQHGPRLAMLRRADRWIEKKGRSLREAGNCPAAEELYDFGGGPGYGPMSMTRRTEIENHLATCAQCEAAVETLASYPPVPLVAEPGARGFRDRPRGQSQSDASEIPSSVEADRPRRALPRLVPLAIAASLVLALGVWVMLVPSDSARLSFPEDPLLRGSSGGPLFFPRGRVLHPSDEARKAFPALGGRLVFEIEPQQDATLYHVDIAQHGGDAFAAEEENLARLSSNAPSIEATVDLAPGRYTWTSQAVVRGLEQALGARDFEVVDDVDVSRQLAELGSRPAPDRSLAAVRLLHEHGYLGDARALARATPESPERDAYLGRVPGR